MTSKLHVVCHSPLRLHLSEGQCSNFTDADWDAEDLPPVAAVIEKAGWGMCQSTIVDASCFPRPPPVVPAKIGLRPLHHRETCPSTAMGLDSCQYLARLCPHTPLDGQ